MITFELIMSKSKKYEREMVVQIAFAKIVIYGRNYRRISGRYNLGPLLNSTHHTPDLAPSFIRGLNIFFRSMITGVICHNIDHTWNAKDFLDLI